MANIGILGSGGFGLAVAIHCVDNNHNVCVWSKFRDEVDTIKRTGQLSSKLAGVDIPKEINVTTDKQELKNCEVVLVGIPSNFVRDVCMEVRDCISENTIVVNLAKGFEESSYKRMSEVLAECFPQNKIVVLTGPSHAEEVARKIPTTVVCASNDSSSALRVQKLLSSGNFRIYVNDDVIGCEVGGSLKNIIALAAGVCDGLELGDNTKAALMTRGISEISRLGIAMGAKVETFAGLSGIGDLIVTCTSMHSRNRRAGILIGKGTSPEDAVRQIGTVEGYICTKNAYELSRRLGVEMPITEQLYNVLYKGCPASGTINTLMNRPASREEREDFYLSYINKK